MMRDQDYMPIYKKIKEQILNDIAKGIYGPGDAAKTNRIR